MSESAPESINGYPLVEWHRVIFRWRDWRVQVVEGIGITHMLNNNRLANRPEWTRIALEWGGAGLTPGDLRRHLLSQDGERGALNYSVPVSRPGQG